MKTTTNSHKNKSGHSNGMAGRAFLTTTVGIFCLAAFAAVSRTDAGELPFQGRIEGSFVSNPTQSPAIYVGVAQAVGKATHLGAFTKVTSDVVNILTGEVNGAFTMTSPSGDLLTGVYSGFLIPGAALGTFSWILNATFTGGTGRFVDATGEFVFTAEGKYVFANGMFCGNYTETFDGTINY